MIREATLDDLPALLDMGREFYAASAFDAIGFNEDTARAMLQVLIGSPTGVLLIAEGGMAAALVYPFYFNAEHTTAQELFWWVAPQARGGGLGRQLIAALEAAVQARGAKSLSMIALAEIDGPAVAELYRRHGYRASEQSFIKVF